MVVNAGSALADIVFPGNFVPTAPGEGLGYARLNETSGPYAVAVVLPAGEQPGSVKKLTKVTDADWSPAWSMSDGAGGPLVLWLSTNAAQLTVQVGDDNQLMSDGSGAPPVYGSV